MKIATDRDKQAFYLSKGCRRVQCGKSQTGRIALRKIALAAAIVAALLSCDLASAGDVAALAPVAAQPRAGATLKSADGRRIGFIDRILTGADGQPTAAQLILDGRIVSVPASTITPIDKNHFVTSLSYKDVEHL